ncbi:MAG: hypothetical protein LBS52_04990 [Dysgonamonadaceae bacterium]|jgi:hypothetical protein|nr:hypothetical protein [Dysgonamonadaceae bacterium]
MKHNLRSLLVKKIKSCTGVKKMNYLYEVRLEYLFSVGNGEASYKNKLLDAFFCGDNASVGGAVDYQALQIEEG